MVSLSYRAAMVVSLCSFRSRRRSGSIDVPKRWSRGVLADLGLPGQAQIFILFTHSRFASIFILFGFVTIYSVVFRRTLCRLLFRPYFAGIFPDRRSLAALMRL